MHVPRKTFETGALSGGQSAGFPHMRRDGAKAVS